jgi:hypothetical protein
MGCCLACDLADRAFDYHYGDGPVFSESRCVNALNHFCCSGCLHLDIAKEDALAFEKLRQDCYTNKVPMSIPWFDLALFCSMAKECQRLVGAYVKIKNADGHSAKKRAMHHFQGQVLKAHYRFAGGLAGFSTMVTHSVLSRREFCCSVYDIKKKELKRFMFQNDGIFAMEKQEGNESFHENELRLTKGKYQYVKGNDLRCNPLQAGICNYYKEWISHARTFRSSMNIKQNTESHLAAACALLMDFEGA